MSAAAGLAMPAPLLAALDAASARGALDPTLPGAVYQEHLAREGRRAAGVYYTPPALTALCIEHALAGAPPGARVLDPACGAAAFLVAALARLEVDAVAAGATSGTALRARLAERLTGIDRDPVAADLARLALALAIVGSDSGSGSVSGSSSVSLADALAIAGPRIVVGDALVGPPPAADVVLGNPPWGGKRYALDPAERARLRRDFSTLARGPIDPFVPFVEQSLRALADGGRVALVLPDVVLLKAHEPVRRLLLEHATLELIAHAGRAFPGVNLDAVVVVARKGAATRGHRVDVWRAWPSPPATRIAQAAFAALPRAVFNLHLDDDRLAALAALAPLPRLGDRFEIHEGVHSGNARAKLFVADRPPDGDGARLIVGGGELARFRLRWAGRWLDRSPTALDRAAGDYANLGRAAWFESPKVVVRRTGDRLIAAVDPDGHHVSNNLFVVLPRAAAGEDGEEDLHALVAILNSRLMTGYFRVVVPRVGKLFAELKIQHLADFPLPPADRLAAATPTLGALARRLASADDPDAERALDEAVAALYPLPPRAIAALRAL